MFNCNFKKTEAINKIISIITTNKVKSIKYFVYFLAIIAIALNFCLKPAIVFIIFSTYILYLFIISQKQNKLKINNLILLIPLIFILITRIVPFILYGKHPLGYDTGFYYHYLTSLKTSFFDFSAPILGAESIGTKAALDFFRLIGFSPEFILYGVYIFIIFLIGVFIYLIAKDNFNKNAAFFSLFFYSISLVQFQAYHYMLWKNMFALLLFLVFIYFFKRKTIVAVLFALFAILAHRTTGIILMLTLLPYLILNFKKNKLNYLLLLALPLLFGVFAWINLDFINHFFEIIKSSLQHTDLGLIKKGQFMNIEQYFKLSFIYLPFAFLSVFFLKNKRTNILFYLFAVSSAFLTFHFYFYKRIIIFFDIASIIFAGAAFSIIIQKLWKDKIHKIFLIIFILILFVFAFQFAKEQKPMLTSCEIKEIENLKNVEKDATIMAFSSYYGPWIYGFSKRNVISPGLFSDQWNYDEWKLFLSANDVIKKKMLSEIPKPLYFYSKGSFSNIPKECLENFSPNIKKYICE